MELVNAKTLLAFSLMLGCAGSALAADGGLASKPKTSGSEEAAPVRSGDMDLRPDVGLAVPVSELNLSRIGAGSQTPGDPGLAIGARYLYQTTSHAALGAQLSHQNFGDRQFVVPGLAGTIGGSLLTVEGLASYLFTPEKTVTPYAIAGLGFNRFAARVFETFDPGDVRLDAESMGLSVSAGGGVQARIGKSLLAGAEARWMLSTIDSDKFGSSTLNGLGFTGQLGYRF